MVLQFAHGFAVKNFGMQRRVGNKARGFNELVVIYGNR